MRRILSLFILLLTACVPQYQLPHEQIVQQCTEGGYKEKELDDCISVATVTYNKEIEKQRKEAIKEQDEATKRQREADIEKCKAYGFRKGTKDFSSCMMQIEVARNQAEQQRQALAIQQQIAAQQIEAAERTAAAQRQQNYIMQQQEQKNRQFEAQVGAHQNNSGNKIHCTTRREGMYVYTDCN